MRICLTGATGLLGGAIVEECALHNWSCRSLSRGVVDFRNPRRVEEHLGECEVIIHAAANTNVEECEADPGTCYRDNTLLTEVLAEAAKRRGIKFVYISSTGIYGDYQDLPFIDYDKVSPTTHHHRAKLLGEAAVLKAGGSLVIRTGWLFGGGRQHKKNFVAKRIEEAANSDGVIYSNCEQFGNPTYVNDVARYLLRLIEDEQHGVFNCVNEGFASRMVYVARIMKIAGLTVEVKASPASAFKRIARVSKNEMALNLRLKQCGYQKLPNWEESLYLYIKNNFENII